MGKKVSKSYVDRVLKEAGMVKSPGKKKKGRSKYMKYPEYTLTKLGKSMMSIDFIGPRSISKAQITELISSLANTSARKSGA
ncbi:MAG: hypothetical protein N2V75_13340 [Methanophagales archaeon]|nr:hypothetical protein [Methanophagales archaeon]